MADLFITYETAAPHRWKPPLHRTQAHANAAAAADATLTAHTGAVTIPNDLVTGMVWNETDGKFEELTKAHLPDLDRVKAHTREVVGILQSHIARAEDFRGCFSAEAVHRTQATYALATRGIRAALLGTSATLNTTAKRTKFLDEMASGPSDAADPAEMCFCFEAAGAGGSLKNPFEASDKRLLFVNLAEADTPRISLATALDSDTNTNADHMAEDVMALTTFRTEILALGFIENIQ